MDEAGERRQDIGITTILVGALTGQHELSEADRQVVGEWMIDHAEDSEVRELLTKIVRTQIADTSEFREKWQKRSGKSSDQRKDHRTKYESRPGGP